jgi:hypothetical protein
MTSFQVGLDQKQGPVTTDNRTTAANVLRAVKLVHTMVWAFFATSILAIPVLAWNEKYGYASILTISTFPNRWLATTS